MCEVKVQARRFHWGVRQLGEVYAQCHKNIPYQKRERYVESHLELRLKYFDTFDDLNSPDNAIDDVRKEIQKR